MSIWTLGIQQFLLKDGQRAFKPSELRAIQSQIGIPPSVDLGTFIRQLTENQVLREVKLTSPYERIRRFATAGASRYDIAVSLKTNAYLSHGTAGFLNGIAAETSIVFLNKEQTPKPQAQVVSQDAIDHSFANRQRYSTNVYKSNAGDFLLINGKNTRLFGVERRDHLLVTNLERTLIDMTVRPEYAGGTENVLKAYKAGASRVYLPRFLETLKALNYVYPYHQAIGFYLQHAGFPARQLDFLRELGTTFRFYLGYGKVERGFDEYWCVYYPISLMTAIEDPDNKSSPR
jgi:hypothetical protein